MWPLNPQRLLCWHYETLSAGGWTASLFVSAMRQNSTWSLAFQGHSASELLKKK
jgi:hypothetical protein